MSVGVKPDFFDAFQRNPVEFERGIPPFEPFLRGENAVYGRAVVPNVDCVVQADLVAGLPAPVEENLADPFQPALRRCRPPFLL